MTESAAVHQSSNVIEHPIRNAAYRRWLAGSAVSLLGDQFYLVCLPWLVLQLGSAGMLGTVMMAEGLPRAALMLVGGAVSDRISARWIMMTTAAARAVCAVVIGGCAWLGVLSTWDVYALVIAFGIADAFAIPAQNTYMPALLKPEQLVAGLSLGQGVSLVAYTIGPTLAGLVIMRFGPGPAFILAGASFLVIIGALLRLPDPPVVSSSASAMNAISDGITHVLRDVPLRMLILLVAAGNLCAVGPLSVGLAYLVHERTGSSIAYGEVLSAGGVGALVGAFLGNVWKIRQRGTLILASSALMAVCLVTIPFLPGIWGVAAVRFVLAIVGSLSTLHIVAWVMQRADTAVRGRVSSVLMLAAYGSSPISMAVAGFMATWGATWLFLSAGGCLMVVTAAAACVRTVREIE